MPGSRVRIGLRTVAGMVIMVAMPAVPAADYTYSGGGGGTWDATATGWTGASGTPWDSVNGGGNTATFSGGSPVDVTGGVFTNGITFSSGTTLQGDGLLTFAGSSPTVTVNANSNIWAAIAGSFTKTGGNELYIGGDNSTSLAGATVTLAAGRTRGYQGSTITGDELGPVSTTIDIESGARLRWYQRQNDASTAYTASARIAGTGSGEGAFNNDGSSAANRIYWDGPVVLAADASIVGQNSGSYTFGGDFTEESASTLTISLNTNTTEINAGLTVSGLEKTGNGTLAFGPAAVLSVGTLTTSGGAISFDAGTTVSVDAWELNGGTLPVTRSGIINPGNTISFGGGTLGQTGSDASDYSSQFATSPGQTYRIDIGSNDIEWAADLVSDGGSIVKRGSGTLTLSGDNSGLGGTGTSLNFGSTNVDSGTIVPTTSNAFGGLEAINATGGNAGVSGIDLAGGLSFATPLTTWGRENATTTGYLLRNVSGSNTWSGPITITGGGGNYGLVADADTLTIGGNVSSMVTGFSSPRSLQIAGAGDVVISGNVEKGGTDWGSQDLAISKSGSGTLTLSGTNDYGGTTTISDGRLLFNGDSSLATGAVTVNGGTLGGSGRVGGGITVNAGGRLAPGTSVGAFRSGALSLVDGGFFDYEFDSTAAGSVGADLMVVEGGLDLAGGVSLSLADVAGTAVAVGQGTTFSVINYTGTWNSGLFTVGGTPLADGDTFTVGLNTWQIDYAAASGGVNFPGQQVAGSFVNLTAVPEPASLGLAAVAAAALLAVVRGRRSGRPTTTG